ncbi:MAG: hypothetical protein KTR13_04325 [Saprospiraceae bacterium]|nr:hypothetical protein [Saprospiraceae bacterium]
MPTRLNKYIANAGICNRRQADELIKAGKVEVNGATITQMGFQVQPGDDVRFEGNVVLPTYHYILYNKPKKVHFRRQEGTALTVLEAVKQKVEVIGVQDTEFMGLVLLTDDLDFKAKAEATDIPQIFKITLNKAFEAQEVSGFDKIGFPEDIASEIGLETLLSPDEVCARLKQLDYEVLKIDRVIYAGLTKREIPRGKWRALTSEEVIQLKFLKKL